MMTTAKRYTRKDLILKLKEVRPDVAIGPDEHLEVKTDRFGILLIVDTIQFDLQTGKASWSYRHWLEPNDDPRDRSER